MKVKIVSNENGVQIELSYDTGKRPLKQTLTREQAVHLADMIKLAANADAFRFELELG